MPLNLMGRKKGMTRLFNEKGESIVCTVIQAEPNVVTQVKTMENDRYTAVQLGSEKVPASKLSNVTKPRKGHFAKAKVEPRRNLKESRVAEGEEFTVGQEIGVEYFEEAPFVDVTGTSKGKGFQGVMKRHGHRGGPASHGSSKFHRKGGSTGMRSTPGRGIPGMKMAGHMGNVKVTTEGLRIVRIDQEKQLILVQGSVPGCTNGLVSIRKSVKRGVK